MAPLLSVIKTVKYCGVWGRGRRALGGAKILQKIMVLSLSVITMVLSIGGRGKGVGALEGAGNMQIHVLFEKLTARVVLNFTRCHLSQSTTVT